MLSSQARSSTEGNADRSMLGVPSLEPLCPTMTRAATPARATSSCNDVRQLSSRSQTFQETMMTANMWSGLYQPDEYRRYVEVDGQDLHVFLDERRVDIERVTCR